MSNSKLWDEASFKTKLGIRINSILYELYFPIKRKILKQTEEYKIYDWSNDIANGVMDLLKSDNYDLDEEK